jgi:hypothetical protein
MLCLLSASGVPALAVIADHLEQHARRRSGSYLLCTVRGGSRSALAHR